MMNRHSSFAVLVLCLIATVSPRSAAAQDRSDIYAEMDESWICQKLWRADDRLHRTQEAAASSMHGVHAELQDRGCTMAGEITSGGTTFSGVDLSHYVRTSVAYNQRNNLGGRCTFVMDDADDLWLIHAHNENRLIRVDMPRIRAFYEANKDRAFDHIDDPYAALRAWDQMYRDAAPVYDLVATGPDPCARDIQTFLEVSGYPFSDAFDGFLPGWRGSSHHMLPFSSHLDYPQLDPAHLKTLRRTAPSLKAVIPRCLKMASLRSRGAELNEFLLRQGEAYVDLGTPNETCRSLGIF